MYRLTGSIKRIFCKKSSVFVAQYFIVLLFSSRCLRSNIFQRIDRTPTKDLFLGKGFTAEKNIPKSEKNVEPICALYDSPNYDYFNYCTQINLQYTIIIQLHSRVD